MCTERIEYRKASELPSWHFFLADPLAHYGSEMGQLARSPVSTHRAAQWTEQSVRAAERSELSSESASWRKTLLNDSEIGRKLSPPLRSIPHITVDDPSHLRGRDTQRRNSRPCKMAWSAFNGCQRRAEPCGGYGRDQTPT